MGGGGEGRRRGGKGEREAVRMGYSEGGGWDTVRVEGGIQ